MLKLNAKMFDESAKSHASKNLLVQIWLFMAVFVVIFVFESLIPVIASSKTMYEALKAGDFLNSNKKLTFSQAFDVASDISARPGVMILKLISMGIGTLLSIIYVRYFEVRYVRSMGCRREKAGVHYIAGIGAGALMMSAITLLTIVSGANKLSANSGVDYGLISLYFFGFLIQGMSEEFIFRGYFMTTMGGSHSPYIAVAISSAAFGIAHSANPGISPLAMFNLIFYGVFAALYMIHFDNIWGVCGIHSMWNFTQGNIYGISVSGNNRTESILTTASENSNDILTGGEFGIEGSIFTTVVLLAGTVIILLLQKRKEQAEAQAAVAVNEESQNKTE